LFLLFFLKQYKLQKNRASINLNPIIILKQKHLAFLGDMIPSFRYNLLHWTPVQEDFHFNRS